MSRTADIIRKLYADELSGKAPKRPGGSARIIKACRVAGLVMLAAFYCYQSASWYNMDMTEIANMVEKKSQIEKEYKRRSDLIPSLQNVAQKYSQHERVLFRHISDMRMKLEDLSRLEGQALTSKLAESEGSITQLLALAEQYPDLKAEQSYNDLMTALETSEDRVAERTNDYIVAVEEFDTCNQCFWCNYFTYLPSMFIALPAYWEFFHTNRSYTPMVLPLDPAGKEKEGQ